MPTFQEIVSKKVAGVPVVYIAGAFVAVLVVVAIKMKPTVTAEDDATPNQPAEELDAAEDYSSLATTGTVTVVQAATPEAETTTATNEQWGRSAVEYLVSENMATPSEAEAAIYHYLQGADLSYSEGQLKDAAIRKLKLPPEPLPNVGTVGSQPAQKQIGILPGVHKVKGVNDDGLTKLAQLYYGRSDLPYTTLLSAANPKLPRYGHYAVGTTVNIPAYREPKWYTAGSRDAKTIAAKNGTTTQTLTLLNPGMVFPVKTGTKVRVA